LYARIYCTDATPRRSVLPMRAAYSLHYSKGTDGELSFWLASIYIIAVFKNRYGGEYSNCHDYNIAGNLLASPFSPLLGCVPSLGCKNASLEAPPATLMTTELIDICRCRGHRPGTVTM
jgi:hypothetical protein